MPDLKPDIVPGQPGDHFRRHPEKSCLHPAYARNVSTDLI
jgi:hypothetical protein